MSNISGYAFSAFQYFYPVFYMSLYGSPLMTPSNATSATAFAGNALKKQGTKPLQYPFHPFSAYTALAAVFQFGNLLSPSFSPLPRGSVMILCFTTSLG